MDERLPEPPSEWRYTLRVPQDPLAPAVLLTSELLTNTWRHAPGPASLSLKWADKRLRASFWDAGFLVPYPTGCPEPYAEGGRGLALVELCVDAWGSFAMGPAQGKVVWFELMSGVPGRVAA
ncbi:ATP-binding protein [Streptomyces sp. NBC_00986]|uniref:ATP-binding protein n=1 Tax=Streptomyces sp. NBC_00986 TaxID=2903702 RepID=UPI00386CC57D|nr:ATP-binding protein [Streptomyces sp. NBC_00986]